METVSEKMLQKLFTETVKGIEKRVSSEEACAADFNAAISLLKLNNITVNPDQSETLDELRNRIEEKRNKRKARIAELSNDEITNIVDFRKRENE